MTDCSSSATVSGSPVGSADPAAELRAAASPNGLHVSGTRRTVVGWDVPLTNGERSELARELADGHGLLREVRVLVVDDYTLYREYLVGVLSAHGAFNTNVAWDLSSLISGIEHSMPGLVLLNMATRDNLMLLRHAFKLSPNARVIALGLSEENEAEIIACAEAGVAGFHLRTESVEELIALLRKVTAGESACSPAVSAILLRRLSTLASERPPVAKELALTAREAQILQMLELGLSNRDIAAQLCIALHTVKNHVHSLLTKLDVSTRAQAAALSRTIRYSEDGHWA